VGQIKIKRPKHASCNAKNHQAKKMHTIEIKASRSWRREIIEYFEDLEIICDDYNRMVLRYLGKLNRLLHEEQIEQSEYDALNKRLLQASEALNKIPKTISDLK